MAGDETILGGGRFATDGRGLSGDAGLRRGGGRSGSGRSRAAPGSAATSPPGCSATASRSSTCRRSCRPGRGCSPPGRAARPTPPTRTPSRWSAPAWPACARSSTTQQLAVLRVLVDRRRSLGEDHTRMVSQLHQLLLRADPRWGEEGPVRRPGQGAAGLGAAAGRRRQDPPARRRGADRRPRAGLPAQEGRQQGARGAASRQTGTSLLDLNGIGPSGAARLLVEVGDITRFPSRAHFASWNGTAPIDASSGDQVRHRLSRAGNRQINRVLHIMATVQLRNPTAGRAYYDRRKADGKTSMEAMRALKRRLSDIVYRTMLDDASPPHCRHGRGRAREDTRGRLQAPARPTRTPHRRFGEVTSRTRHQQPTTPLKTAS